MAHHVFNNGKIKKLSEKNFTLENQIKVLVEKNLELFFGLKYVCSEYQLNDLRVDTLAFDEESRCFVMPSLR